MDKSGRLRRLSFFTDREIQTFKLYLELGSQTKVAAKLGVVNSAVASVIRSVRLKVFKLLNALQESLELGLLNEDDVLSLVPSSKLFPKIRERLIKGKDAETMEAIKQLLNSLTPEERKKLM